MNHMILNINEKFSFIFSLELGFLLANKGALESFRQTG